MISPTSLAKILDAITGLEYLVNDEAARKEPIRARSVNAACNAAKNYNPDYNHILDSMPGNIARTGDDDTWFWEKLSGSDLWEAPDGARLYWSTDKVKYLVTLG